MTAEFADTDLTRDAFQGGLLYLYQPRHGYRAGVDPVLLAAATEAKSGDRVLELGCGAGAASLCLARRVEGLSLTGVELQPAYAALAARNAKANDLSLTVINADLRALPMDLRQQQFDHVIANPPYFDRATGSSATDTGRDIALGGDTDLADWVRIAAKRLAPKGYFTMIQKSDRLADILAPLQGLLGSVQVVPLAPRGARDSHLVLVRAKKNGRGKFRLHAPKILHVGGGHERDNDSYVPDISAVLRDGAGLSIWD